MRSLTFLNYRLRDFGLEERVCKQNRGNVDKAHIHSIMQKLFAEDYYCILKQIIFLSQPKPVYISLLFCSLQKQPLPLNSIAENQQQHIASNFKTLANME